MCRQVRRKQSPSGSYTRATRTVDTVTKKILRSSKVSARKEDHGVILNSTPKINKKRYLKLSKVLSPENCTSIVRSSCINKEKKFFKSKIHGPSAIGDIEKSKGNFKRMALRDIKNKQKGIKINRKKELNESSFNVKVKDSKDPMAVKCERRLRPRKNVKNYCEESMLLNKHITPGKRNSIVKLERLPDLERKIPIYKTVKDLDTPESNKNEIYDFIVNGDGINEKLTNTKRKRNSKKPMTRKTKKIPKNKLGGKIIGKGIEENLQPVQQNKIKNEVKNQMIIKKLENNLEPHDHVIIKNLVSPEKEAEGVPDLSRPEIINPSQNMNTNGNPKPKIVCVQSLDQKTKINIVHVLSPVSSAPEKGIDINTESSVLKTTALANFKPFRPTNIFNNFTNPNAEMMNHSLLNKPLSPISKMSNDFDTSSPWRPPTLNVFSQMKQMVHSTPQVNQSATLKKKTINTAETKQPIGPRMHFTNLLKENENSKDIQKKSPKKSSLDVGSPRQFGTELSNVNSTVQSNVNTFDVRSETALLIPGMQRSVVINKENTVPTFQSPKNSLKKSAKQANPASPKAQENLEIKTVFQKLNKHDEIIAPQPGPSGLQTVQITHTKHGLFDDVNSAPINTDLKKKKKVEPTIENAFGFDDSNSIVDNVPLAKPTILAPCISQCVDNKATDINIYAEKFMSKPARISIEEITKLLTREPVKDIDVDKAHLKCTRESLKETKSLEGTNVNRKHAKKIETIRESSFLDTFDQVPMSENEKEKENSSEISLFEDLEPVHFNKPPRYSYKRTRPIKYSFSEDEEDQHRDNNRPGTKKKRINKAHHKDEERLKQWVKSINDTFSEIDHYDLVVE
ncbi:uncharacterized protein LOC105695929 isoform X2 [Orussus abietinus]|uniref:uncharacterized protein LOC105695929 isoform X2 n=1 Tax=Orussus abietinus TaxID=222816 RepID=UPI0006257500|nr:uncharacterized protein LOC105695929 isoform X2 [Orussus abietinus]